MKKVVAIILIGINMVLGGCAIENKNADNTNDKKILDLISKMTFEEKIGQMYQVSGFGGQIPDDFRKDLSNGKIGSVINEVNVKTINEIQRIAIEESRLGIPLIIGRDVIHGFKTIFPIPLGQAATWNPDMVKAAAGVAAKEAWSSGINWTFAPMIDISRDARWGRIAESCGEDPYLTSVLGVAMVEGFQGESLSNDGSILACAKHFAGYGAAEGGRDYNTTLIPEGELRNIYLKPFRAAKEAGVGSFMSGFNDLNGVPATGNTFLLRKVLRNEWDFNGFVVSDWASITEMMAHGFAANEKDAGYKAITAGVDMEMVSMAYKNHLKSLLDEGKIDEKLLDEAVYRILKIKFDLGLFENPYIKEEDQNKFALPEYLDIAKKVATEGIVLLKNKKNILPLASGMHKVALIGPMANQKYEQLGTWIFDGDTNLTVTPLQALIKEFGESNVLFAEGLDYSRSNDKTKFKQAVNAANQSDVVVLCLGEESILSGEAHSRASLLLPGAQTELLEAVAQTGKPVILVIMAGRPLEIGSISKHVEAILYSFHPGTMGGPALVDLLTGNANPSGKLPVTFPKSSGQIPFYYNHKNTGRPANASNWTNIDDIPVGSQQTSLGNNSHHLDLGYEPLYPFGFGLSYTTFTYKNLSLKSQKIRLGENITAIVTLENKGNYAGEEVVQLYIRDIVGSVTRPVKELKGFKRIHLKPGESQEVSFTINTTELAFFNQEMREVTEPGEFQLWIGGSSESDLQTSFTVE